MKTQPSSVPVLLVTGGSAGIGAACVRRFLAAGWHVATLSLDSGEQDAPSSRLLSLAGDVTDRHTRERFVQKAIQTWGRIDVLINNAGIGLYSPAAALKSELLHRLMDVNVYAPLSLAQLVLPIMLERGAGSIVSLCSVAGSVSLPWAAGYCASKSALQSLHDSLRRELKGTPVHVLKVVPGIVDTNFRAHVLAGKAPQAVRRISRVVSPDAVAAAIFDGIRHRRRTVCVPKLGVLFSLLGHIAPRLMDWYLAGLADEPASLRPEYAPVAASTPELTERAG